jgi:hypothetical protein
VCKTNACLFLHRQEFSRPPYWYYWWQGSVTRRRGGISRAWLLYKVSKDQPFVSKVRKRLVHTNMNARGSPFLQVVQYEITPQFGYHMLVIERGCVMKVRLRGRQLFSVCVSSLFLLSQVACTCQCPPCLSQATEFHCRWNRWRQHTQLRRRRFAGATLGAR